MARIDWAVLCDFAFFDRHGQLCIVGITRQLNVPMLPMAISQVVLVARLADIRPIEEVAISVAVVTPSGIISTPTSQQSVDIELTGEYVLATLRGIPLTEEGIYGFRVLLQGQPDVSVDIPVLAIEELARAEVH